MNIYLNVEISSRELDSKLLLATVAAARGHRVVVSDLESILKGVSQKVLAPGIFHTKSLTPAEHKISLHKLLLEKGFKITSNDEEGGIEQNNYEWFAKNRFSDKTLNQTAAVFGWGPEDTNFLKKLYPNHSSKFHMTGSPRVDLWKPFFKDYWGVPSTAPLKPFLLVSSNMAQANREGSFLENYKFRRKLGYTDKIENDKRFFSQTAESYLKTYNFIEALKLLSKEKNNFDIVFRPHPSESINNWIEYLKDIPNIYVIREDSISAWVNNAFAVMQNGCTTALEAMINQTPLINYKSSQEISYFPKPYDLGFTISSPKDLLIKINSIFKNIKSNQLKETSENLPSIIYDKIYLDKNELAAEKIVNVWESLNDESISKTLNLKSFKVLLKAIKLRKILGKFRKSLFSNKPKNLNNNEKFPMLKENEVKIRIKKFQDLLKIDKIKCELLSERTILIEK